MFIYNSRTDSESYNHLYKIQYLFPFNQDYRIALAEFYLIKAQEYKGNKQYLNLMVNELRRVTSIDNNLPLLGNLISYESELGLDVKERFKQFIALSKNGPKIKVENKVIQTP